MTPRAREGRRRGRAAPGARDGRRIVGLLAVAAGALGLAASPLDVAPASAATRCAGATSTVRALGASRAAAAVVCLTNVEREAAGLRPLKADARLARAARAHAADMDRQDYFEHESADGTSFADRIERRGYAWSAVGENIAAGQTTPRAVVRAWIRSKGHCANVMSRQYTQIGVGAVRGGPAPYGGPTWVQDFGRPRSVAAPGGPTVRCPRKPAV